METGISSCGLHPLSLTQTYVCHNQAYFTRIFGYEMKNPISKSISLTSIPVQSYNTFTSLRLHGVHTKRECKPTSKVLKNTTGIQNINYRIETLYFSMVSLKSKRLWGHA